jgi:membrane protein DedA with SNARE-associated domain
MPRSTFFWTNLIGASVWTAAMAAIGYSGGQLMPLLISNVKEHEWGIAGAVALAVFCAVILRSRGHDFLDRWRLLRSRL